MKYNLVEFDNNKPVYIQIMEMIKKQIINGDTSLGERLPSVRDLAGILEVNANTIQRAYKELEREEITLTKRGMGSFVTSNLEVINILKKQMADSVVDSFIKDMEDMGFEIEDIISILKERG